MYDTRTEPDTFSPQSAHAGSAPPRSRHSRTGRNPTTTRHSHTNRNPPLHATSCTSRNPYHHPSPFPKKLLRHSRDNLLRHSRDNLLRHSREGGNPQFPRMREFIVPLTHYPVTSMPKKTLRHSPYSVIPSTPSFPRQPTPSFPRRRESTIPAHAGIHRPINPHAPMPKKTLRHSPYSVIPSTPSFPR